MSPSKTIRPLRVLVLTYQSHVPPTNLKGIDLERVDWRMEHDVISALRALGQEVLVLGVGTALGDIDSTIRKWNPDVAFNLLDEFAGETLLDHNVASYLELLGIPFTGSNSRGLMLSRDKALTKKLLVYHEVPVPEFHVFPRHRKIRCPRSLKFPAIVKSLTEEASLGISQSSVVPDEVRLEQRVAFIHRSIGTDAIAEAYIPGRELYVGVLGNSRLEVLPSWELTFRKAPPFLHRIATRRVKWNERYRRKYGIRTGPARLPESLERKVQDLCRDTYRILGMSGYARIDLRLEESGKVYVLEANPNPHIGRDEAVAEAARQAGIQYPELIWRIICLGLAWQPGQLQVA